MELYVVRHGEAARYAPGGDADRPLTEQGARQVEAVARGLQGLGVELDALLASPLRRAQETAGLLAPALGGIAVDTRPALDGGAPASTILRELREWTRSRRRVAIVGHQPVLGELVTLASFGAGRAGILMPPAGVVRIDFPGSPRIASGELVWLVTPDVLDRMR